MAKNLIAEAERYLSSQHKDKRRSQVLRVLAVLVVFVTIYALILPAVTMSNEVECGMAEHVHSESCWEEQLALPQPQLVCTVGRLGTVLHTHDSYCYDSLGELVCSLEEREAHVHGPECYQEQRTLLCGQVADPGHQHGASCYSYIRMENADVESVSGYTCGMQEGGDAHRHVEECYPEERAAEPLCGREETGDEYDEEGNVVRQGHSHTEECWLVRVHEKLVCGQEETDDQYDEEGNLIQQGHRHTGSCRLTGDELCYQYGCGRHESAGHVHTAACGQGGVQADSQGELWEQVLTCGEEEREPGHVHADECYEINQVLTCHRQEIQPHTHGAGCYDEGGALICGKAESLAHQHTSECFFMPEGDPEPTRTLICGQEEHTHTEQCFVKLTPKDEQAFYCGQNEHIHTMPECFFETGALRCTLVEHVHDLTCMEPPAEVSEEPVESQEPVDSEAPEQPVAEGVELTDAKFTYVNEAFTMTFTVNGFAQVADDGTEPERQTQSGGAFSDPPPAPSGEELVDITNQMVPLAAMPRMLALAAWDDNAPDSAAPPSTDEFNGTAVSGSSIEPEGTAVDNSSHTPLNDQEAEESVPAETQPAASATPVQPEVKEERQLLDPAQVRFVVEPVEDTEEWEKVLAAASEMGEGEQAVVLQMLSVSAYAGDGRKLDLSGWDIYVEAEFSDELVSYAASMEEQVNAISETDEASGAADAPAGGSEAVISVMDLETYDEMTYAAISESRRVVSFRMNTAKNDGRMALMLIKNVYPHFDVQYYAYIKQPDTAKPPVSNSDGMANMGDPLPFIDTSAKTNNGKATLPSNEKPNPEIKWIQAVYKENDDRGAKGSIIYDEGTLQQIYLDSTLQFNPQKEDLTVDGLLNITELENDALETMSQHYELGEVWVLQPGGDPDDDNAWEKYPADGIQFTNNPAAADLDNGVILIQETEAGRTALRLVYDQKKHKDSASHSVMFYDYDVTEGVITEGANKDKVNVEKKGINGNGQTADNHGLGFGNGPGVLGTGLGANTGTDGKKINMANSTSDVYRGCSFGLVSSMNGDNDVTFGNGVTGPSLFGTTSKGVTGKTLIDGYSLKFKGEGDTYTMTAVTKKDPETKSDISVLDDLDRLQHIMFGYKKKSVIWSNEFWPLDKENAVDPKFGARKDLSTVEANDNGNYNLPDSDFGEDHNAYFGMHFTIQFTLPKNYVGPLEYYFYGDDDMWVFMNNTKVCDIGGVHSAVGEYVDLWDYLGGDEARYKERPSDQTYTLSFFYTERGASGSTCWMQYTLPNAITVPTIPEPGKGPGLTIEKEVAGNMATEEEKNATYYFDLDLTDLGTGIFGGKLYAKDESGNAYLVNVTSTQEDGRLVYTSNGEADNNPDKDKLDYTNIQLTGGKIRFPLKHGWKLVIQDLPATAGYTVKEVFPDNPNGKPPEHCVVTVSKDGGGAVAGDTASDTSVKADGSLVLFTNSFGYELPETGGTRAQWYTMAGLPLTTAMFCLWYKKKSRGEGAADEA